MNVLKYILTATFIVLLVASPGGSALAFEYKISSNDKIIFQNAFTKVRNNQYEAAIKEASRAGNPVIHKLITWFCYQDGFANNGSFEISDFLSRNPNWPNVKILKNKIELGLTGTEPPSKIIKYFEESPPVTGHGMRILAEAKMASGGSQAESVSLLKQAWYQGDFSRDDEDSFLKFHGKLLTTDDHYQRADHLLWEGDIIAAKRIYPLLDNDHKSLLLARLQMMDNNPSAISKVPNSLRSDQGILYEQLKLQNERENFERVYELLYNVVGTMKFQPKWWKIKNRLIRELLDKNQINNAYHIAKNHGNVAGSSEYSDAQWLAGWIALRFLGKSQQAYDHFYNIYQNVKYPVSLSRAAYWLGRSAEMNRDNEIATQWYHVAAKFSTTFYGQLAYSKIYGKDTVLALPDSPQMGLSKENSPAIRELLNAAYILESAGHSAMAEKFIKAAINSVESASEMAYIGEFGLKIGRPNFAVIAGKEALNNGVVLVDHGWPNTKHMPQKIDVEKPFALAIMRQESLFNPNAVSPANAMGLMQLIPPTAKRMAKLLNLPYTPARLLSSPEYNIRLGSHYLGSLVNQWDGSYILAIASYNAGPGNARKWINKYKDPRQMNDIHDIIDWIESIPFTETRNYVQRVLENIQVYRSTQAKNQLTILDDLAR